VCKKVIVEVGDGDNPLGCERARIVAEAKVKDIRPITPGGGDGAAGDGESSWGQSKGDKSTIVFYHLLLN